MAILLSSGVGSVWNIKHRPSPKFACFAASASSADQLRAQLDHLHSEAETARSKASNARVRLLRLSEAAENLKRQAAISVRKGKEDEARELLFQKKKVMEALDKSKNRIELLDELSKKLNEAISLKETQLIGNVALDVDDLPEDASGSVHIVSPVPEVTEDTRTSYDFTSDDKKVDDDQGPQSILGSQEESREQEDGGLSGLKRLNSFAVFLEHMDEQLDSIEAELVTVLRVSTLILDGEEKTRNFKVQQTMELLESIRRIRQRIAYIRLSEDH